MERPNKLHIVFPKDYQEVLLRELPNQGYSVVNSDYTFDTFYHWATSEEENAANVAIIAEATRDNIPIEIKLKEMLGRLTEIRIKRSELRLILFLPVEANYVSNFKESLVQLGIYDFYFADSFTFDSLIKWIEHPKSLSDVKEYILTETPVLTEESASKEEESKTEKKKLLKKQNKALEKQTGGEEQQSDAEIPANSRIARSQSKQRVKTIVEEKIIEKVITIQPKKIAIHSLSKGAGATFHAMNLAAFFQEQYVGVGVFENPVYSVGKTYQADAINLFQENSHFSSVPHQVARKIPVIKEQIPVHKGISFYSLDPEAERLNSFSNEEFMRYMNISTEIIKIMDFGYLPMTELNDYWQEELFKQFDLHIVCIDMMPLSIIPNMDKLALFLNEGLGSKAQFLINKHVDVIQPDDLEEIGINESLYCPYLSYESIYKASYENELPFHYSDSLKKSLTGIYEDIGKRLEFNLYTIPTDQNVKRTRFFGRLFK
ncbi:hypothetical protein [Bacillus sp. 1P06AnD]|uniref:hypothetical protein n=1 Tax=Bacillus sp. 1P06AnD TaxID=3132208 RepID=UPI0039A34B78